MRLTHNIHSDTRFEHIHMENIYKIDIHTGIHSCCLTFSRDYLIRLRDLGESWVVYCWTNWVAVFGVCLALNYVCFSCCCNAVIPFDRGQIAGE